MRGTISLNGGHAGPRKRSPVVRRRAAETLAAGPGPRFKAVRVVTLEERPERDLAMDTRGRVHFEIGKKKILTLEFVER